MISGDDDPPKMIGSKKHSVMTHSMDLSASRMKNELLRQVKLSNSDSYIDEAVSCSSQTLGPFPAKAIARKLFWVFFTSLPFVSIPSLSHHHQSYLHLLVKLSHRTFDIP